jgi:uncharacterized protein YprB with RNaseH-like and TPR domain
MLKSTFLHIPGFPPSLELELWNQGVRTWEDFLNCPYAPQGETDWYQKSLNAYKKGDANYFAARLHNTEHWRLAASFPAEAMFLDIETTGFSPNREETTIIGWSLGGKFKVLVNGRDDPADFVSDLARAKTLVTFNGRSFDLKFLEKIFDPNAFPKGHADLRYLCQRLGLTGGLKLIEIQLGLARDVEVRDGAEAVALWWRYVKKGDPARRKKALRDLIRYNHADVEGLKTLFEACLDRLRQAGAPVKTKLFAPLAARLDFSDPGRFPFSLDLMDR